MKNTLIIFLLITFINFNYAQEIKDAQISGTIINHTDKKIKIGHNTIPIFENGHFNFIAKIERPTFYDLKYAELEWSIYLEPGKKVDILVPKKDVSTIEYKGELTASNNYLKQIGIINQEINDFFNENWVQIHSYDESKYISVIDSLKGLYIKPLSVLAEQNKDISIDFIKFFKADIDFGFNRFIIYYPESHLVFTGEKVPLSQAALNYIDTNGIDNPEFIDLPSYRKFCKAWIDYETDMIAQKNNECKHYNLKKMDAIFQILPDIFENQFLLDYWFSEYLIEHIDNNGISNSMKYINRIDTICKTEEYKNKINKHYTSKLQNREDHEVKVYKTINEFILEAHIFKSRNITRTEKRSAIVIFHGGGWNGGNPSWAFGRARHFKDMGMVAIAAQYRLTNKKDITATESMADARDLIKWMRSNSNSLNISPDSIVAYGWSAGAHLASSAAIFSDSIPAQQINSIPNALIFVSPAVSLPQGNGWEYWKYSVLGPKTTVSSVNPVEHVRAGLPPTIILQGRDDTVTPLDGVQLFHDKMLTNGNYCELWIYDGVGHLFTPSYLNDKGSPKPDQEIQKKAFKKADEFLIKFGFIKK